MAFMNLPYFSNFIIVIATCTTVMAGDAALAPWRQGVNVRPVTKHTDRHVIHAYFNTSPESPDGRYVLYYTSGTLDGELGDLRIQDRDSGIERIIATDIATEDAHRAACQQWSNGGKTVTYHQHLQGKWRVMAVDIQTGVKRVLAEDRQLGFGSPMGKWAPIYGCHWNPGKHRDIEFIHVETGEIKTIVRCRDVIEAYGEWIRNQFGTDDISLFFPVVNADESKLFFKLAHPSGDNDFRSSRASVREGKVVFDVTDSKLIRLIETWGHPSWSPDGCNIFEYGNVLFDLETGKTRRFAPSCITNHPSLAPDAKLFVTDADVTKRNYGKPGDWAVAIGSCTSDDFVLLHVFGNSQGATSWRHNHPHPSFSADGQRVYFNVNEGRWTSLMVAEASKAGKAVEVEAEPLPPIIVDQATAEIFPKVWRDAPICWR